MRAVERDPDREYGDGVAVVTVTQPPAEPLDRFLGSLDAATAAPVRVVVADTAGAEVPAGVDVLRIGEDVGRHAAANRAVAGLDPALGWVVVADPGVQWCAGALDALLDAAARHPRAGALGPRLRAPAGGVLVSGGSLPTPVDVRRGKIAADLRPGPVGWVSASCLLLRRAAWDSVDGFDPRYRGAPAPGHAGLDMAAVDLGDRLGRAGWLAVHVPTAEVTFTARTGPGIRKQHEDGLRRYRRDRSAGPVRTLLGLGVGRRRI